MAFNNTRTIMLHGPRGMEWYCPTSARPPWETEKRHHQEVYRDTSWAAKPFPSSQPAILGECATPGWEKRWSWTYIEACNSNYGLSRHFLRRNPHGELLLRENLIGHTYRILMNAANGVLPAQPDSDFPEPHCSRPLMSLHCYTWHNDKGEEIEHYYVTYKLPNGAPQLAPKVAATRHALQKRDGSWCLLPKTETQVPESWQPPNKQIKSGAQKPFLEVLAAAPSAVVMDVIKGSASAVKDACTKVATKAWEVGCSLFTKGPEKLTAERQDQKPSEDKKQTTPKLAYDANTINKSNYSDFGNLGNSSNYPITKSPNYPMEPPNYPIRAWSWTAIQMTDRDKTIHGLRCSPEGRLLFKKQLIGHIFSIYRKNVDCTTPAEPSMVEIEEACSMTHVEIAPNTYAVVDLLPNGQPQLPKLIAHQYDLLKNSDGSWSTLPKTQKQEEIKVQNQNQNQNQTVAQKPVLEANAEEPVLKCELKEPPAVVKEADGSDKVKPTPNSGNFPITKLPSYPILDDLEKLISDYLVCSPAQRTVLALWILHTYSFTSVLTTPYLNIFSPLEESGKSTCMAVLRGLCSQTWWAAGVSPAQFKRKFVDNRPTVLLDNWHTVFRGADKQQMTGFLLSGCNMVRDLCFNADQPEKAGLECTFSPKAFAGLESLPPTLARRSIPIVLQRRKPQEKVKSVVRLMFPERTSKFTSWMKDWAENHSKQVEATFGSYEDYPPILPSLTPHQQQSANVLIALAEVIGGEWPQKARAALLEIFSEYNGSQVSPVQLLSDIRDAFAHYGNPERLFTAELLEYLHGLDHRTYYQWNKQGDPMTASALARILDKHFKIYPRSQRRGKKLRGYQQCDFQEVWDRYLPNPDAASKTSKQSDPDSDPIQADPRPGPTPISLNKIAPCLNVPGKTFPKTQPLPNHSKNHSQHASPLRHLASKVASLFASVRS